jgi:TonB-dependent receptor
MARIETKIVRKPIKMTALSIAVAQAALVWGGAAHAQTAPAGDQTTTVVVTGQRAAMQSATKLKQYADEVIDAVVAEEAGKLPDKSITEVLQRVAGVTIDRNNHGDPEHFNVEGSGISVRGLTWGSSTLNGRESFSAGYPGRELSWGDVPPELMSAVVVHKNPPAELIEGGVSGQVDLRTALPFDYKDSKVALSVNGNYNALGSKKSPGLSGLVSNRWKTRTGEWGALIDLSANQTNYHNDSLQMDAYYPRTDVVPGKTVWVPKSAEFRTNTGKTDRVGIYGALQWKSNDKSMESALTYFHSGYKGASKEQATFSGVGTGGPDLPYLVKVQNPVFDDRGVLQKGTLTMPLGGAGANQFAAGGMALNSDTAGGESRSQTRELAWNFKWNINDRWSVQNDVQWVHATDSMNGYDITLGTFAPAVNVDMTSGLPKYTYDDATRAFLANRNNYFLFNMMPQLSRADGDLYAWKSDVRFRFDHPVLRDLRFGFRVTQRSANHYSGGDSWKSLAEPWAVLPTDVAGQLPSAAAQKGQWQPRLNMGYFSDPRYGNIVPTTVGSFPNFFNGKVPAVPNMVVPTEAWAANYPTSYTQAVSVLKLLCEDGNTAKNTNADCSKASDWTPLSFDGDPSKVNRQKERTQAVYGQLRFGFDELRFPVEGNLGVRVVRTSSDSHGYMKFTPTYGSTTPPSVPQFGKVDTPIEVGAKYTDVLPSLNLKADLTDKVQTRFAFAKSMYRPSFSDLQEYVNLNQTITTAADAQGVSQVTNVGYTGKNLGNGRLKPIRANSFDWTLEWYPGNGSSLTMAVFRKNVRDIILKTGYMTSVKDLAGNPQDFLITGPDNVAKGSVTGLELAGQTYFNNVPGLDRVLPDWAKGFGISANYTYIDSKQELYHPFTQKYCPANGSFNNASVSIYGCDTNGLPFTSMPLQYLSKNAYNLMFLYDRGPVSARLAYSWRSRFLQGVGTNGTGGGDGTSADPARAAANGGVAPKDVAWGLPTWQEATGMLDFGIDYKFTDRISGSFSASNLTDVVVRQTQQQMVGNLGRAWFEPGRSFRLSLRYTY